VKNEANVENEANETGSFIDTPHGRAEVLQAQTIEDFLGSSAVCRFFENHFFIILGILLDL